MKLVKESINEDRINFDKIEKRQDVVVQNAFEKTIAYLRKSIYPSLNDDDLYELNFRLKKWFNDNVY